MSQLIDVAEALTKQSQQTDHPALLSIREARRQLGGIGSTAFYAAVKRHGIQLVKLGGRSLVPAAEINRVVSELCEAGPASDAREKARALAARSVASRRRRRGGTP